MTDDVKKPDVNSPEFLEAQAEIVEKVVEQPAATAADVKDELANEPEKDASPEVFTAAAKASAHVVVAATEPEMLKKPEPVADAPEGTVAMHPAQAAISMAAEFMQLALSQGVHPAQAAGYIATAGLSLLRQLGLSGRDVADLAIHHGQTWRLMTETKGQKPN